jgi:hypothetical protein
MCEPLSAGDFAALEEHLRQCELTGAVRVGGIEPCLFERLLAQARRCAEAEADLEHLRDETVAQWLKDELADYDMVMEHCSEVYYHFSGGRISKPQTLPSEVIAVAEELRSQRDAELVGELVRQKFVADESFKEGVRLNARLNAAVAREAALRELLARILDDGTGDLERPDKRLWPLRAAHQREGRRLLQQPSAAAARACEKEEGS